MYHNDVKIEIFRETYDYGSDGGGPVGPGGPGGSGGPGGPIGPPGPTPDPPLDWKEDDEHCTGMFCNMYN